MARRLTAGGPIAFRKIYPGLYGTGLYRESRDGYYGGEIVEVVIDRVASGSWHIREWVAEDGVLTDALGEWYPTLAAAQQAVMQRPSIL